MKKSLVAIALAATAICSKGYYGVNGVFYCELQKDNSLHCYLVQTNNSVLLECLEQKKPKENNKTYLY
tara:strand:+ start:237 stop:440 length:204 start_codon:yes stop_codon:yes gene_type:complete